MAKRPTKSESLTIRLDPKTRFMLEFVSRVRGQTITTVVERAISESANAVRLREGELHEEGWRDFWRVIEGERTLLIACDPQMHPTYEEERILAFARKHWPFFYLDDNKVRLNSGYIEILWPRIDEFVDTDEQMKATDYFAASKAMIKAISEAGVEPPEWPLKVKRRPSANAPAFESGGMDDDIPF